MKFKHIWGPKNIYYHSIHYFLFGKISHRPNLFYCHEHWLQGASGGPESWWHAERICLVSLDWFLNCQWQLAKGQCRWWGLCLACLWGILSQVQEDESARVSLRLVIRWCMSDANPIPRESLAGLVCKNLATSSWSWSVMWQYFTSYHHTYHMLHTSFNNGNFCQYHLYVI